MEIKPPRPDFAALILYAIAAVSGALGGCASGAHYFLTQKQPRIIFFIAYVVIGIVFGVITLASTTIFMGGMVANATLDQLILTCAASGSAGSLALASANWTIRAVFRRLGVEVQFTIRKEDEDRRTNGNE